MRLLKIIGLILFSGIILGYGYFAVGAAYPRINLSREEEIDLGSQSDVTLTIWPLLGNTESFPSPAFNLIPYPTPQIPQDLDQAGLVNTRNLGSDTEGAPETEPWLDGRVHDSKEIIGVSHQHSGVWMIIDKVVKTFRSQDLHLLCGSGHCLFK